MKTYFIVYKTVNLVNDKFYYGVHKTSNLNDKYLGSGTVLICAIKKYGRKNFKRKILFIYKNKKEAYKKEKEIITEEMIKSYSCYNIQNGGKGGWDAAHRKGITKLHKENISEGMKKAHKEGRASKWNNKKPISKLKRENISKGMKKAFKDGRAKGWGHMKGKRLSEETKKKISNSLKKNNKLKLSQKEIRRRRKIIDSIDTSKYGWVSKAALEIGISHTQLRKFVDKHYKNDVYKRKSKEKVYKITDTGLTPIEDNNLLR